MSVGEPGHLEEKSENTIEQDQDITAQYISYYYLLILTIYVQFSNPTLHLQSVYALFRPLDAFKAVQCLNVLEVFEYILAKLQSARSSKTVFKLSIVPLVIHRN